MVGEPDKGATGKGRVIALRPEQLSIAEQQMLARKAARVAIPTRQRDFSEIWQEPQPKPRKKTA